MTLLVPESVALVVGAMLGVPHDVLTLGVLVAVAVRRGMKDYRWLTSLKSRRI